MGYKTKADYLVIGAGIYGLYTASFVLERGYSVIVLEKDTKPFQRASYVNQARLHNGYHYPRSVSTAERSALYFERFYQDFKDCIYSQFEQVYAISSNYSFTNALQFRRFCNRLNIRCDEISPRKYFRDNVCESAFIAEEFTFDAKLILNKFLCKLERQSKFKLILGADVVSLDKMNEGYMLTLRDGSRYEGYKVINATYASVNQLIRLTKGKLFNLKYELCEVVLCDVSDKMKNVGITVMDGPFFSVMPFGISGMHSLTSVTFTPHFTSFNSFPVFECQKRSKGECDPYHLANCNDCSFRPETAWDYMSTLARKYLRDELKIIYRDSIFAIKPILNKSETDDSRPTMIMLQEGHPDFISVLSGKINTIYDLDEILD